MKFWMPRAKELFDKSLNSFIELDELDWKIDINQEKIHKHLIAMANLQDGGFFVFGISDNRKIVGLKDKKVDEIRTKITNIAREGAEPKISVEFEDDIKDEKRILFAYVKESIKKPVHLKGKGIIEGAYIRVGGSTRKASQEEVANMLLYSHIITYEEMIAKDFDSIEALLREVDYKSFFVLLKKPLPSDNKKIFEELIKFKIIRQNGSKFGLTNLGVLTIAHDMSNFSGHFNRGVRILKYEDKTNLISTVDAIQNGGYAIECKPIVIEIMSLLPKRESRANILREEIPLYPRELLKEIIANALIHQDFRQNIHPRIEIFSNRIEITNAGNLLKGINIDTLISNSKLRNPLLAETMRLLHVCEARGSGINTAFLASEIYKLPPLKFINMPNYFKVIIFSPKSYKKMTKEEKIEACYQHCARKFMNQDYMTNTSLRERFGIKSSNRSIVSRIIKSTIEQGKIKISKENSSPKNMRYIPIWA